MKKYIKFWPLLVFALAVLVYFWKVFFKGYVPFPADLMVGAYLPWIEYKWGYIAGVPIKNPLISDIFSQFYMWKSLIAEGWRTFQIPLWNPYSYSGYPLLANFHSGVFYPLNIIQVIFGDIVGWDTLVIFPSFASAVTMYLYLRQIKLNKTGSVIGGLIYSFSGFAISWAQFVTAAQAMIWMPLIFIILEKYFYSKKTYYLYWIPIIFFLLITSGHFQIMVYISALAVVYFIWKWLEKRDFLDIRAMIIPLILTLGMSAFQLLPTIEMTNYGMRTVDKYISGYNYGLLPIKYLVTLLSPDYFGNPATGNYFGVFNYHEAIFYTGVLAIFTFMLSLFLFKENKYVRFFVILGIISFMLGFDTPLGRSIYTYKIPLVSTSAAGRIAVIFSMSLAVLAGIVISNLEKIKYWKIVFVICILGLMFGVSYYLAKYTDEILLSQENIRLLLDQRRSVTMRNLILPAGLIGFYSVVLLLSKKWRVFTALLIVMTCLEMFRFGWKYIPFVPQRIVYPETPITNFLVEKSKTEIFRIDRERAEIMPPATWMQYRLMSPSGYDPMAIKEYTEVYLEKINADFSGNISRYSQLERYDSKALGEFNVKYLVVVKRGELGLLGGENINYTINQKEWKKVFETYESAILENTNYKPRARFLNPSNGEIKITSYKPNEVKIIYSGGQGNTLLLADTYYVGWKAYINKKEVTISKCDGVFRCIPLNDDSGEVIFSYQPKSFYNGLKISIVALLATVVGLIYFKRKK